MFTGVCQRRRNRRSLLTRYVQLAGQTTVDGMRQQVRAGYRKNVLRVMLK